MTPRIHRHPDAQDQAAQPLVTVIRPQKGWVPIDLAELWRYRELFLFMIWRDLKVRYKQTALGMLWALVVPFTQMGIFGFIFGTAGLPSDGLNYNVFMMLGLVPWNFFSQALTRAGMSLVGNAHLLTKIYFPRVFVPLSAATAGLVDFAISFVGLVLIMLLTGTLPAATTLWLPLLVLIALATALGVGIVLAALNVKYRDIGFMIPFLLQIWMWCSILLPFATIHKKMGRWAYLYGLNPIGGVVEGFRWCMAHPAMEKAAAAKAAAGQLVSAPECPWPLIAIGGTVALLLVIGGMFYFRRVERQFADIV